MKISISENSRAISIYHHRHRNLPRVTVFLPYRLLKLAPTSTRLWFGSCIGYWGVVVFVLVGGSHSILDPFSLPACPLTTPTLLQPTSQIFSLLDVYQLRYRRHGLSPSPELPLRSKNKQTGNWYKQCLACNSVFFRPLFQVPMPCHRPPHSRILSRHFIVGTRLTLNIMSPSAAYATALVVRLKRKTPPRPHNIATDGPEYSFLIGNSNYHPHRARLKHECRCTHAA